MGTRPKGAVATLLTTGGPEKYWWEKILPKNRTLVEIHFMWEEKWPEVEYADYWIVLNHWLIGVYKKK